MPEPSTVALFLIASLALLLVPGPAVIYIVTRAVTEGRKAGIVSVLGIHVGTLVHIGAAVLGLSALLLASATAFTVVKWLGAAYLVLLGIRAFLTPMDGVTTPAVPLARTFWQGALVNTLNPKTAVFFIAFVPQFVDPGLGSATTQLLILGGLFVVAGLVSDGAYAVAAGSFGERLLRDPKWRRGHRYASGTVYLALGAAAALGSRPTTR